MDILNNAFEDYLPEEDLDLLDYYMDEQNPREGEADFVNDTPEEVSWEST